MKYTLLLPLLLLAIALPLRAQERPFPIPAIATPPSLPFGLLWGMSEEQGLETLRRVGIVMNLTESGREYTRQEIRRYTRSWGVSEQQLRDERTWHSYEVVGVRIDSVMTRATMTVEFYRGRLLRVSVATGTRDNEDHLALADSLDARYSAHYGRSTLGEWSAMPTFPSGRTGAVAMMAEGPSRPDVFRGWSGIVDGVTYGTAVYTNGYGQLALLHMTDQAVGRKGRRSP